MPTTLLYIGHSSTLLAASDGTRIISDPYGDSYPVELAPFPNGLTSDLVTVSHFHPDHFNTYDITGESETYSGTYEVGMVKVTGYQSDHGLLDGPTGENTVFVFQIGKMKIVHLGAAGVVTQSDILTAMENADVVIMDIMGDAAHPLKEELDQLLELDVRIIIPTHYRFDENSRYYGSATLDEFLQIVPSDLTVVRQESALQITANMPKQPVILTPLTQLNK